MSIEKQNFLKKLNRYLIFAVLVFSWLSCRKDNVFLKGEGTLSFSKDTVYFDTVFTRLPGSPYPRSINKRFMVRNPYKESVKVNAKVMGGSSSQYRFNVDGRFGIVINDIEILPKDSAWVFVECTLDPNNLINPVLVRDSLSFETNGKQQFVQLAAYGWDAYYYKDSVFEQNTVISKTDKPHVIVNSIFVDKNVTLTIEKGVHFYSTANSVFRDNLGDLFNISAINVLGTLKVNGTATEPVVFEGDRLQPGFENQAGQWRGIHFYRSSVNNELKYTEIKNATIGIRVDSLSENSDPNLIVRNTIIKNISAYGILGLTAEIYIENSMITNCGANTLLAYYGGNYTIRHCTFYGSSGRRDPHLIFNNQLRDDNKVVIKTYPIGFAILNSIIWGVNETEIGFDLSSNVTPNPALASHSIIRSKAALNGVELLLNQNPLFKNLVKNDFKLESTSPAINKGSSDYRLTLDLEDKTRSNPPDMGAYEFQ